MTQDNRYIREGEPVITERVVETTRVAPVVQYAEPVRRCIPA